MRDQAFFPSSPPPLFLFWFFNTYDNYFYKRCGKLLNSSVSGWRYSWTETRITCTKDNTSQVSMKYVLYLLHYFGPSIEKYLKRTKLKKWIQNKEAKQTDSRVTLKPNPSNVSLGLEIIIAGNHIMGHLRTKLLGANETLLKVINRIQQTFSLWPQLTQINISNGHKLPPPSRF